MKNGLSAIPKSYPSDGKLGGKDPAYVRADADLPYAIEQLVDGENLTV